MKKTKRKKTNNKKKTITHKNKKRKETIPFQVTEKLFLSEAATPMSHEISEVFLCH